LGILEIPDVGDNKNGKVAFYVEKKKNPKV
jgi:hypothetical protein